MLCNFTDTDPSVQFSHPVSSDALQPHGLQHARLPCSSTIPSSQSLLKPVSVESVMPSNHLVLCRPLLPLPLIFPGISAKINALEQFPVSSEPASFVLNTLILPDYSSGPPVHAAAGHWELRRWSSDWVTSRGAGFGSRWAVTAA